MSLFDRNLIFTLKITTNLGSRGLNMFTQDNSCPPTYLRPKFLVNKMWKHAPIIGRSLSQQCPHTYYIRSQSKRTFACGLRTDGDSARPAIK